MGKFTKLRAKLSKSTKQSKYRQSSDTQTGTSDSHTIEPNLGRKEENTQGIERSKTVEHSTTSQPNLIKPNEHNIQSNQLFRGAYNNQLHNNNFNTVNGDMIQNHITSQYRWSILEYFHSHISHRLWPCRITTKGMA